MGGDFQPRAPCLLSPCAGSQEGALHSVCCGAADATGLPLRPQALRGTLPSSATGEWQRDQTWSWAAVTRILANALGFRHLAGGRQRMALVAAPVPGTSCAPPLPIPAGQQLPKPRLSLGVCPWASYLMFLSLDFLIIEMAVRTQRAWCVGLKLGASRATVGAKPIVGDPWKRFPAQEATQPICDPQTSPQPVCAFLPIRGIE